MKNLTLQEVLAFLTGLLPFITALLIFLTGIFVSGDSQQEKQAQRPKTELVSQGKVIEKVCRTTTSTVTTTETVERVTFVE